MKKRKKIMSAIFPAINILVPAVYILANGAEYVPLFPFTICLGSIVGGLIPLTVTIVMKLDTSEGFGVRCIYFGISAAACVLSWVFTYTGLAPLIVPIICVIIYGFILKEFCLDMGLDTPISGAQFFVMLVSNPLMPYIGLIIDIMIDLMTNGLQINIPG